MSAGSRYPTGAALAALALVCFTASSCGSSSPAANPSTPSSSPGTVCHSLADFDTSVKDASHQITNAPKQAQAAVRSLDKQFTSLQHDLQQKAPRVAGLLDQAMKQLDQQMTGSSGNQNMQEMASSLGRQLTSVSAAIGKVENRIGC